MWCASVNECRVTYVQYIYVVCLFHYTIHLCVLYSAYCLLITHTHTHMNKWCTLCVADTVERNKIIFNDHCHSLRTVFATDMRFAALKTHLLSDHKKMYVREMFN